MNMISFIICDINFWKEISSLFASFATIIAAIVAIIALIYAIIGINTWKKQIKAKRKLDIAEDALAMFYELKDIFRYLRNPFVNADELNDQNINNNLSEKDKEIIKKQIDSAYIPFYRFNKKKEFFKEFNKVRYRFIIYFGKENILPFNEIEDVINDILRASDMLGYLITYSDENKSKRDEIFNDYLEQKKYRSICVEYHKYDSINKRIDESIIKIEKFCKDIIKTLPD
jgi:hypothetical protein